MYVVIVVFSWSLPALLLNIQYVPVQDFQEYLVTLLESSATTESCFQSLRKR